MQNLKPDHSLSMNRFKVSNSMSMAPEFEKVMSYTEEEPKFPPIAFSVSSDFDDLQPPPLGIDHISASSNVKRYHPMKPTSPIATKSFSIASTRQQSYDSQLPFGGKMFGADESTVHLFDDESSQAQSNLKFTSYYKLGPTASSRKTTEEYESDATNEAVRTPSIGALQYHKENKLEDCDIEQISYIIKNLIIKDEENGLFTYRDAVVKYFIDNKIDGAKFILLVTEDKDKFVQDLKSYINVKDNKLDGLLMQFVEDIRKINLENISIGQ